MYPRNVKLIRGIHEDELEAVLNNNELLGWIVISVLRSEADGGLLAVFTRSHRSQG
jgi:hypothetical protein